MMTASALGQLAPDLSLSDEDGHEIRLRGCTGRHLVLYFYPKDNTPGCTKQACALRDEWADFDRDDVLVYGVSPDSAASHQKFRAAHDLPFHLLVDTDHAVAEAFDIWREKTNYGRKYMGIERTTVVIAPDSTVLAVKRRVKPAEHTDWLRGVLGL